jgi:hypothetical protein
MFSLFHGKEKFGICIYIEIHGIEETQADPRKKSGIPFWNGEESEIQDINPINKKTKSSAVSPTK